MTGPLIAVVLAATPVLIFRGVIEIPAGQARVLPVQVREQPAVIEARFRLWSGSPVTVGLVELDRQRPTEARRLLRIVEEAEEGRLRHGIQPEGHYQVVIENRDKHQPARVWIEATLDPRAPGAGQPETLPATRKKVVVLLSAIYLAALALGPGQRLLRQALRRKPPEPPLWFA